MTTSGVLCRRRSPEAPEETVCYSGADSPGTGCPTEQQGSVPCHLRGDKAVMLPHSRGSATETRPVQTPLSPPPLLTAQHCTEFRATPRSPEVAVRAVFYFIELIQASLGMALPLNHRPDAQHKKPLVIAGWAARPLRSHLIRSVLLCVAFCPLPSHQACMGERGVLYAKASPISRSISSGERPVPRDGTAVLLPYAV